MEEAQHAVRRRWSYHSIFPFLCNWQSLGPEFDRYKSSERILREKPQEVRSPRNGDSYYKAKLRMAVYLNEEKLLFLHRILHVLRLFVLAGAQKD